LQQIPVGSRKRLCFIVEKVWLSSLTVSFNLKSVTCKVRKIFFHFNSLRIFLTKYIVFNFSEGVHFDISKKAEVCMVKIVLLCGIGFAPMVTIPYALLRWIIPCNSATLGYFLIPECENFESDLEWGFRSKLMLICISMLAFYCAIDGCGNFAMFLANFSLVQAYCLRRYVQYLTLLLQKRPSKSKEYLPIYRQLQILCRYYNLFQQNGLIFSNYFLTCIGLILSSFSLISNGFNLSLFELLLFATVSQDTILVLLIYGTTMGQLYSTSKKFCFNVKKQVLTKRMSMHDRKWADCYTNSFRPLKCYLGCVNFVDELTPLVMLNLCINQTVSLLMLR